MLGSDLMRPITIASGNCACSDSMVSTKVRSCAAIARRAILTCSSTVPDSLPRSMAACTRSDTSERSRGGAVLSPTVAPAGWRNTTTWGRPRARTSRSRSLAARTSRRSSDAAVTGMGWRLRPATPRASQRSCSRSRAISAALGMGVRAPLVSIVVDTTTEAGWLLEVDGRVVGRALDLAADHLWSCCRGRGMSRRGEARHEQRDGDQAPNAHRRDLPRVSSAAADDWGDRWPAPIVPGCCGQGVFR